MQFIDDHKLQMSVEFGHSDTIIDKIGFEGFWSDQQYSRRRLPHLLFAARRDISMPSMHSNVEAFTELLKPFKLVVDQSLERSHVQRLNRWLRILNQFG